MNTQPNYLGVLHELVSGTWQDADSGARLTIPIKSIEIRDTLDGIEGELIRSLHGKGKILVVCDQITEGILGSRVAASIGGCCDLLALHNPKSTMEGVKELQHLTRNADILVAVGSGTVSDLIKYASFLSKKTYSVFPTSPMNAYTTGTASITQGGTKRSLPAHSAKGVFVDLKILSDCPKQLVNSALSDVVCRSTAQVDWLLSQAFWDTPYSKIPYTLLAYDEESLFANAQHLHERDFDVLASLVRTCALNGLGSAVVGTTHPGSMAEHMVSHYLDMFAGDKHPGTLHGEQVGVTSLSISRIQNKILHSNTPPQLQYTKRNNHFFATKFGSQGTSEFAACYAKKEFTRDLVYKWNVHLADNWDEFVVPLRNVMLSVKEISAPLVAAGAHMTPGDLGFDAEFYIDAVKYGRFIRDRFTILDVADDCGILESMEF